MLSRVDVGVWVKIRALTQLAANVKLKHTNTRFFSNDFIGLMICLSVWRFKMNICTYQREPTVHHPEGTSRSEPLSSERRNGTFPAAMVPVSLQMDRTGRTCCRFDDKTVVVEDLEHCQEKSS